MCPFLPWARGLRPGDRWPNPTACTPTLCYFLSEQHSPPGNGCTCPMYNPTDVALTVSPGMRGRGGPTLTPNATQVRTTLRKYNIYLGFKKKKKKQHSKQHIHTTEWKQLLGQHLHGTSQSSAQPLLEGQRVRRSPSGCLEDRHTKNKASLPSVAFLDVFHQNKPTAQGEPRPPPTQHVGVRWDGRLPAPWHRAQ